MLCAEMVVMFQSRKPHDRALVLNQRHQAQSRLSIGKQVNPFLQRKRRLPQIQIRYGPVPNGIKLKTNPDGSVQFVSGALANEADPMGLTNTNQAKQQDAFITAQETLSLWIRSTHPMTQGFQQLWGKLKPAYSPLGPRWVWS
jgi:hypothetical protein